MKRRLKRISLLLSSVFAAAGPAAAWFHIVSTRARVPITRAQIADSSWVPTRSQTNLIRFYRLLQQERAGISFQSGIGGEDCLLCVEIINKFLLRSKNVNVYINHSCARKKKTVWKPAGESELSNINKQTSRDFLVAWKSMKMIRAFYPHVANFASLHSWFNSLKGNSRNYEQLKYSHSLSCANEIQSPNDVFMSKRLAVRKRFSHEPQALSD